MSAREGHESGFGYFYKVLKESVQFALIGGFIGATLMIHVGLIGPIAGLALGALLGYFGARQR
jgi:hypothetical protein